ncbi:MAG: AAA family ATPase [Streptococcaceae bacterium]|jgi:adenylate kinase family enzyme|nr:AAA family ATPase [Streptococcaceae bacterium]
MKFYIVGSVGAGKSTLARRISEILSIPVYHLDEVVHKNDTSTEIDNVRRSDDEIHKIFQEIMSQNNFIIEDCLRDRFTVALQQVDSVIFLDIPLHRLYIRILIRWIKQKLGVEKANYHANLQMLSKMFTWVKESPRDKLVNLQNLTVLHNQREVSNFLKDIGNRKEILE